MSVKSVKAITLAGEHWYRRRRQFEIREKCQTSGLVAAAVRAGPTIAPKVGPDQQQQDCSRADDDGSLRHFSAPPTWSARNPAIC
jgi:hypothetical protein